MVSAYECAVCAVCVVRCVRSAWCVMCGVWCVMFGAWYVCGVASCMYLIECEMFTESTTVGSWAGWLDTAAEQRVTSSP